MQEEYSWDEPPINSLGIAVHTDFSKMCELNIKPLITKAANRLATWGNKDLTLMGRVLVVNTLIESMFVYRFTVTPLIQEGYFQQIQDIIWKFIWKNKRAKINFDTLSASKDQGGLRLVDLKAKHKALIAQWFVIIHKDQQFLLRDFEDSLKHMVQVDILRFNIRRKDIDVCIKNDSFWHSVYGAWCEYNFHTPTTYESVNAQIIWCNSHIRIQGEPFINLQAYRLGIKTIEDLTKNNVFLTWEEFNNKAPGCMTWLGYRNILASIPKQWIKIIQDGIKSGCDFQYEWDKLQYKKKISRCIYEKLTTKTHIIREASARWEKVLNEQVDPDSFKKAFKNLYTTTNVTKLRDFQYRLLHKRVPCNQELHRWKIKHTPKCDFCENEGTVLHTMIECKHISEMWLKIKKLCCDLTGNGECTFTNKNIVLNEVHTKPGNIVNLLVLIAKQLIYRKKCKQEVVKYEDFIRETKLMMDIENHNARKNNKVALHHNKWAKLVNKL